MRCPNERFWIQRFSGLIACRCRRAGFLPSSSPVGPGAQSIQAIVDDAPLILFVGEDHAFGRERFVFE